MTKTIAYIRVSKDSQDIEKQEYEIYKYAQQHQLNITDWIKITISSRQRDKARRIEELKERLDSGDTLLVTELSRLGRSTIDLLSIIKALRDKGVRIVFIKQGIDTANNDNDPLMGAMIKLLAIFAELERDFISIRTKEALAALKAKGVKLGAPKGSTFKSKFDEHQETIIGYLAIGLKPPAIAKKLGLTSAIQLRNYIKKRKLKEFADKKASEYNVIDMSKQDVRIQEHGKGLQTASAHQ